MVLIWATSNNKIYPIDQNLIAYFLVEKEQCIGVTKNGARFECKYDLSTLENLVSKKKFYRLNNNILVNTTSIVGLESYFDDTSVVKLKPHITSDVVINKDQEANLIQFMGIRCFN